MGGTVLACQFCGTLNRVDISGVDRRPICESCGRPIVVDRPLQVTQDNFQKTVLEADVPVLVDFYADWCGPCHSMAPLLDEVAAAVVGKTLVVKVNTDGAPTISERYNVRSIPFFARFERGQIVRSAAGVLTRAALMDLASVEEPGASLA